MSLAIASVIPPMELRGFSIGVIKLTWSGSYSIGGDACNVNTSVFPGLLNAPDIVVPMPNPAAGYFMQWDKANNKMKVFIEQAVGTNTPLAEHTAVALNANLTGATIYALCVWFSKALSEDVI